MYLEVTYTADSTGMTKDIKVEIPVISGHILYDYHAEGLNKSNNIETTVRNWLKLSKMDYLTIWKVYLFEGETRE